MPGSDPDTGAEISPAPKASREGPTTQTSTSLKSLAGRLDRRPAGTEGPSPTSSAPSPTGEPQDSTDAETNAKDTSELAIPEPVTAAATEATAAALLKLSSLPTLLSEERPMLRRHRPIPRRKAVSTMVFDPASIKAPLPQANGPALLSSAVTSLTDSSSDTSVHGSIGAEKSATLTTLAAAAGACLSYHSSVPPPAPDGGHSTGSGSLTSGLRFGVRDNDGSSVGGGGNDGRSKKGGKVAREPPGGRASGSRVHNEDSRRGHRSRDRGDAATLTGGSLANSSTALPTPPDGGERVAKSARNTSYSAYSTNASGTGCSFRPSCGGGGVGTRSAVMLTSESKLETAAPLTAAGTRGGRATANSNLEEHLSRRADAENDGRVRVPYQIDAETFDVPLTCPDDNARGADRYWCPGKPLRVAYVTWNMAKKRPRMGEVAAFCIRPNAHLVVVGTQENGPYIATNHMQRRWVRDIGERCLNGQYKLVGKVHMWAIHLCVFARARDVAPYVSHVDRSRVSTGLMGGAGGNKGGVAVSMAISMVPRPVTDPGSHRSLRSGHAASTATRPPNQAPSAARAAEMTMEGVSVGGGGTGVPAALEQRHPYLFHTGDGGDFHDDGEPSPLLRSWEQQVPRRFTTAPRLQRLPSSITEKSFLSYDDGRDSGIGGGQSDPNRGAAAAVSSACHSASPAAVAASDAFSTPEAASLVGGTGEGFHTGGRGGGAGNPHESPPETESSHRGSRNKLSKHHTHCRTRCGEEKEDSGIHESHRHCQGRYHRHHHGGDCGSRSPSKRRLRAMEYSAPVSSYMTILCVTAHLAAHQGAVQTRNRDYRRIVRRLRVGYRGKHHAIFRKLFHSKRRTYDQSSGSGDHNEDHANHGDEHVHERMRHATSRAGWGEQRGPDTRSADFGSHYGEDLDLAAMASLAGAAARQEEGGVCTHTTSGGNHGGGAPAAAVATTSPSRSHAHTHERYSADEGNCNSDFSDSSHDEEGEEDDELDMSDDGEMDVATLQLPSLSHSRDRHTGNHRDVTEEFDVTLFGGDLNYRIDGTRQAIEYIVHHHKNIRSILIHNDQLTLERSKGTIFQHFKEGALFFRPTYKYELSAGGGVTLDAYNFSHKSSRLPSYCDRVLYKLRRGSTARRVAIRLYTDVPNVRTSDHRPVVAIFDIATRVCLDGG